MREIPRPFYQRFVESDYALETSTGQRVILCRCGNTFYYDTTLAPQRFCSTTCIRRYADEKDAEYEALAKLPDFWGITFAGKKPEKKK